MSTSDFPDSYKVRIADGRKVQLDFISPSDRVDLLAGFEDLSPRSRYLRFFSSMPCLPDFITDGLLKTDSSNHVAIGARLIDTAGNRTMPIVGVARYFRSAESPHVAEPAIAVVDKLHGLGLGKLLLRRLSWTARANGVTHFRAHVLGDNRRIKSLLRTANAEIVEQDGAVLIYDVDIRKSARPRRGVLARLLAVMLGVDKSEARH
jgi:GNAT superfamily N-acetyltransferase